MTDRRMWLTAVMFVALSAGSLTGATGCGSDSDSTENPTTPDARAEPVRETKTLPLAAAAIAEATFTAGGGDIVKVTITSPDPVIKWQIYTDGTEGKEIVIEKTEVATDSYVFTPNLPGNWKFYIENAGTGAVSVTVEFEFSGAAKFGAWL